MSSFINSLFGSLGKYYLREEYDNKIDTENNDILIIKSPFDNVPKTYIPSIKKEILNKKNQIKSLVLKNLGNSTDQNNYSILNPINILKKKLKQRPNTSSLKLHKPSFLKHKNYTRNRKKELNYSTNEKLSLGKLNFFSLQEYKPSDKKKFHKYDRMEKYIQNSKYFSSQKGKILTKIDVKYFNKIHHNHSVSENFLNKTKENNSKKHNRLSSNQLQNNLIITDNQSFNKSKLFNNNNDSNELNFYKTFTNYPNSKKLSLNKKNLKKFEIKYFKQVDKVNKKIGKMNKTLFKISDKSKLKKKESPFIDKVIENALSTRVKKKKQKDLKTKELFLKTSNEKDIYSNMEHDKKELLKLSEMVQNMNDEEALRFSDKILKNYSYKGNLLHLENKKYMKKRQKSENIQIRKVLEKNDLKLKRLIYHMNEEKNNLKVYYKKIFAKNKNV